MASAASGEEMEEQSRGVEGKWEHSFASSPVLYVTTSTDAGEMVGLRVEVDVEITKSPRLGIHDTQLRTGRHQRINNTFHNHNGRKSDMLRGREWLTAETARPNWHGARGRDGHRAGGRVRVLLQCELVLGSFWPLAFSAFRASFLPISVSTAPPPCFSSPPIS